MPAMKISSKRQLTRPSTLAKQAGSGPHDRVWVTLVGDEIRLRKVPDDPVAYFAGILSRSFANPDDADRWLGEERDAWHST
ncbi:MAG: hypothetical protein M0Z54_14065 [Thermaerobacter sp.]|nr:hypothetical protein [Thermaerobacter sp.]